MAEGNSVSAHVIKLHGYVQRLEALGVPFPMEFETDLILKSLPPSYAGFVMNFNMHGMNKTLGELFAMLKVAEKDIQKGTNHVMMVKKLLTSRRLKEEARHARLPRSPKRLSLDLSLRLSVSSVRRKVTGRGIARST